MAHEIELSLRIPNMKVRAMDEHGYPIDHSTVRFRRTAVVASIPKPGEVCPLTIASGHLLPSTVVRADWHDARGLFVVACQYANRSISPDEYQALVTDPDWQMTPLI